MGKLAEKKLRQFQRQRGLCFYCGCAMRIVGRMRSHARTPDDAATFEHLDDRYSEDRGMHSGSRRVVLACHACNQSRGDARTKSRPLEELHERSGRRPSQARAA